MSSLETAITNNLAELTEQRRKLADAVQTVAQIEERIQALEEDLRASGGFYVRHSKIPLAERHRVESALKREGITP